MGTIILKIVQDPVGSPETATAFRHDMSCRTSNDVNRDSPTNNSSSDNDRDDDHDYDSDNDDQSKNAGIDGVSVPGLCVLWRWQAEYQCLPIDVRLCHMHLLAGGDV